MTAPRTVRRPRFLLLVVGLLTAASPALGHSATLRGQVVSGSTPLMSFTVLLYATDPSQAHQCAGVIGAAPTRRDGSFEFSYTLPANADAVLYLIAEGGSVRRGKTTPPDKCRPFSGPVVLAPVVGTAGSTPLPTDVVASREVRGATHRAKR